MNSHDVNELEERLRAMRPAEPGPAVRQRIAASLDTALSQCPSQRALSRTRRAVVLVLGVAAVIALAGVVFLAVTPATDRPAQTAGMGAESEEQVAQPAPAMWREPTVLALTQAWSRSPESLGELLEQTRPATPGLSKTDRNPVLTAGDARRWVLNEELP